MLLRPPRPLIFVALLGASALACAQPAPEPPAPAASASFDPFAAPLFDQLGPEVTGIDHPSTYGGGVAVGDVDGDGLPDLFFADWYESRLFRNLGDFTFVEVENPLWRSDPPNTGPPGAREEWTGPVWGVTFADYDNDADPDLFLLISGRNRLLRNDGDFEFTDVTQETGFSGTEMTYSLALQDFNLDGWLDLYFVNHLDLGLIDPLNPPDPGNMPRGEDQLMRARGDGSFEDVSSLLPEGLLDGVGWTAAWSDLDDDGDRDLYVASEFQLSGDESTNHLFRNDGPDGAGGWRFTLADEGCFCALSLAPMGLATADYDRDGLPDLFMTNTYLPGASNVTRGQGEVLLRNTGDLVFVDVGAATGANLAAQEDGRRTISWGAEFFDADNDGWLDLAIGYGPFREDAFSAQPNGLLINEAGTFAIHEEGGTSVDLDTRGVIAVDLDGDGCLDLVEGHTQAQPGVFRNRCSSGHGWLQLELVGTTSTREPFGARVRVVAGGATQTRELIGGTVHSSPWTTLQFGLGVAEEAESIEIRWPSGLVERRRAVARNQRIVVTEGSWNE